MIVYVEKLKESRNTSVYNKFTEYKVIIQSPFLYVLANNNWNMIFKENNNLKQYQRIKFLGINLT